MHGYILSVPIVYHYSPFKSIKDYISGSKLIEKVSDGITSITKSCIYATIAQKLATTSGVLPALAKSVGQKSSVGLSVLTGLHIGRTVSHLCNHLSVKKRLAIATTAGMGTIAVIANTSISQVYAEKGEEYGQSAEDAVFLATFAASTILENEGLRTKAVQGAQLIRDGSQRTFNYLKTQKQVALAIDSTGKFFKANILNLVTALFIGHNIVSATEESSAIAGEMLGSNISVILPLVTFTTVAVTEYVKNPTGTNSTRNRVLKAAVKGGVTATTIFVALPSEKDCEEYGKVTGELLSNTVGISAAVASFSMLSDHLRDTTIQAVRVASKLSKCKVAKALTGLVVENAAEAIGYFACGVPVVEKIYGTLEDTVNGDVLMGMEILSTAAATYILTNIIFKKTKTVAPGIITKLDQRVTHGSKLLYLTIGAATTAFSCKNLSLKYLMAIPFGFGAMKLAGSEEELLRGEDGQLTSGYYYKLAQCDLFNNLTGGGLGELVVGENSNLILSWIVDQVGGSLSFNAQDIGRIVTHIARNKMLSENLAASLNITDFISPSKLQNLEMILLPTGIYNGCVGSEKRMNLTADLFALSFNSYLKVNAQDKKLAGIHKSFIEEFERWYPQRGDAAADNQYNRLKEVYKKYLWENLRNNFKKTVYITNYLRSQGTPHVLSTVCQKKKKAENFLQKPLAFTADQAKSDFISAISSSDNPVLRVAAKGLDPMLSSGTLFCSERVKENVMNTDGQAKAFLEEVTSEIVDNSPSQIIDLLKHKDIIDKNFIDHIETLIFSNGSLESYADELTAGLLNVLAKTEKDLFAYEILDTKQADLLKEIIEIHVRSFLVFGILSIMERRITSDMCTRKNLNEFKTQSFHQIINLYMMDLLKNNPSKQIKLLESTLKFTSKELFEAF